MMGGDEWGREVDTLSQLFSNSWIPDVAGRASHSNAAAAGAVAFGVLHINRTLGERIRRLISGSIGKKKTLSGCTFPFKSLQTFVFVFVFGQNKQFKVVFGAFFEILLRFFTDEMIIIDYKAFPSHSISQSTVSLGFSHLK